MKGEGWDRTTRKKKGTGLVNNRAGTVNMGDGVLISGTIEASGDILKGNLVLMTHTPKGGKSVWIKATWWKIMEEGKLLHWLRDAETRERPVVAASGASGGTTGPGGDGGRVEEAGNLTGGVSEGVVVEGVVHNGLVDGGASMREA